MAAFGWLFVSVIFILRISLQAAIYADSISVIERLAAIEQSDDSFFIANNGLQWSKTAGTTGIFLTGKSDASTRQLFRAMNVNVTNKASCRKQYTKNFEKTGGNKNAKEVENKANKTSNANKSSLTILSF